MKNFKSLNLLVLLFPAILVSCGGGTPAPVSKSSITVAQKTIPPGASCLAGGVEINSGVDDNRNSVLEFSEIDETHIVCNGESGQTSLLTISDEPTGLNCANGGKKIEAGIDENNNSVLNTSEVDSTQTQFICSVAGTTGIDGQDGNTTITVMSDEPAGLNCANGGKKIEIGFDVNQNFVLDALEIDNMKTEYLCDGGQGVPGTNGLVNVTTEAPGSNCEFGGNRIVTGLDLNSDNTLDVTEEDLSTVQYVCNGITGDSGLISLVSIVSEPAGVACAGGGQKLVSGIDIDGNGVLGSVEITDTQYLCDGSTGLQGIQGEQGLSALALVTAEAPGLNCVDGGKKVETGLDDNSDGTLSVSEVDATNYVCDGAKGVQGYQSLIFVYEESAGTNCTYGGKRVETGVDVNNNALLEEVEVSVSYICNNNKIPVGVSNSLLLAQDTPTAMNLFAYDFDGDVLSYSIVGSPANGTLSGIAPAVTYTPNLGFSGTDTLTFVANDGSSDSALATVNITVIAVNNIDNIEPLVADVLPLDTGLNVPVDTFIQVTFNERMDASTLNSGTVVVNNGATNLAGYVTYDDLTKTLIFAPTVDMLENRVHTVTISSGVKDRVGNALSANYSFSFTTQEPAIVIPPVAENLFPVDGSTVALVEGNVVVRFNKAVDATTVDTNSFTLMQGVTPVAGTVSYVGLTAVFNPDVFLDYSVSYTAKLTTAITDNKGNAMLADQVWDFTTTPSPAIKPAETLAAGNYHNCAIIDSKVKCWGRNDYGQLGLGHTANIGDHNDEMGFNLATADLGAGFIPVQIAAGFNFSCALSDLGAVKCWGYNANGQLGRGHTSNIGDGANEMGDYLPTVALGTGKAATKVTVGRYHACVLLSDKTVKCWGYNGKGQLGRGHISSIGDGVSEMGNNLPVVDLGVDQTVEDVGASRESTCALLTGGAVKCWGYNNYGQLGLEDNASRGDNPAEMGDNLPVIDLGTGRMATALAAGYYSNCALLDNGLMKCWGYNASGQLGLGHTTNRGTGVGDMGDNLPYVDMGEEYLVKSIYASKYREFKCAHLDDDSLKCWGNNSNGKLGQGHASPLGDGNGEMGDALPVIQLGTGRTVVEASLGYGHVCVLLDDGSVKCFGENSQGQLGKEHRTERGSNTADMGDALKAIGDIDTSFSTGIQTLAAGNNYNCAIIDSAVKCWGSNDYGQLGLGHTANIGDHNDEMGFNLATADLGAGFIPVQIAAGFNFSCALSDLGAVKCWGYNGNGQLGRGHTSNIGDGVNEMGDFLPIVALGAGKVAIKVTVGRYHACVLLSDKTVKCWGYNGNGQLGRGHTSSIGDGVSEMGNNLPVVDLGVGQTVEDVGASRESTCALLTGGAVKCWGHNNYGQLGLEDNARRGDNPAEMGDNLPVIDLGTGRTATALAAGYYSNCALLDNGLMKCWGYNASGQLGLGHTTNRGTGVGDMGDNLPYVDMGEEYLVKSMYASKYRAFKCAHLDDDSLKCWGNNSNGKLGQGHTLTLGDGNGEMGDALPVIQLGTGRTVVEASLGYGHVCVLLDDGSVKCFGENSQGQLGKEHRTERGSSIADMGDALKAIKLD